MIEDHTNVESRALTEAEIAALAQAYVSGKTVLELVRPGLGEHRIRGVLGRCGVLRPPGRRRGMGHTAGRAEKIRRWRRAQRTWVSIADALGLNARALAKWVKRNMPEMHGGGRQR